MSLAASVINAEVFACAHAKEKQEGVEGRTCSGRNAPAAAAAPSGGSVRVGGYGAQVEAWMLEGVGRLLATSQELHEQLQQMAPFLQAPLYPETLSSPHTLPSHFDHQVQPSHISLCFSQLQGHPSFGSRQF